MTLQPFPNHERADRAAEIPKHVHHSTDYPRMNAANFEADGPARRDGQCGQQRGECEQPRGGDRTGRVHGGEHGDGGEWQADDAWQASTDLQTEVAHQRIANETAAEDAGGDSNQWE